MLGLPHPQGLETVQAVSASTLDSSPAPQAPATAWLGPPGLSATDPFSL